MNLDLKSANHHFSDAESALKYYSKKGYLVNSQILEKVNSTKHIDVNYYQPQVFEIFLDLHCDRGLLFLEQSWALFNSSYRWMLWTPDYNQTLDQLEFCRVLVDSRVTLAQVDSNSVTLYDLHKVHHSLPFTVTLLERWTTDGEVYHISQPKPRDDFFGVNIIASVVIRRLDPSQSNFMKLLFDPRYYHGIETQQRFTLSILSHIAERYNFTTSNIYKTSWGSELRNGTFTGILGDVQKGDAEVAGSYMLFKASRMKVADFLMQMSFAKTSFLFLQPKRLGSYKALVYPLDKLTWFFVLLTILTLVFIKNISRFSEGNWSDNLMVVFSSISQQGSPEMIESFSGRLFFLTLFIFSFLIMAYYSTALLGALILPAPAEIQNWDQLMKSDLKLGVENDAQLRDDLQADNEKSLEVRKKLSKTARIYYPVDEGLEKVKKGGFAFHFIIIDNYWKLQAFFSDTEICSLTDIDKIEKGPVGLIAQKNSPYKEHFRRTFQLLSENGITKFQREFWISGMPVCHGKQEKVVINMNATAVAFLIIFSAFISSLLVLIAEIVYFQRNHQQLPFVN
ncbi:hypothetical protein O3M35_008054 [Rhynocoris fuscipes]|uniref:Uncharacterized protein n=1 Tax=Rhynocoris fuscipes TaxID=488301 RepID=A0AAW1D505_9HEMI